MITLFKMSVYVTQRKQQWDVKHVKQSSYFICISEQEHWMQYYFADIIAQERNLVTPLIKEIILEFYTCIIGEL